MEPQPAGINRPKKSKKDAFPSQAIGGLSPLAFLEQWYKFLAKTGRQSQFVVQLHKTSAALHVNEDKCSLCSANQLLPRCKSFKKLPIERVRELRACFNCLRTWCQDLHARRMLGVPGKASHHPIASGCDHGIGDKQSSRGHESKSDRQL